MRQSYALTPEERQRFWNLRTDRRAVSAPHVWKFWGEVAAARGLDYKSIIADGYGRFSGLPEGHGKHWCYPEPLHLPPPKD